MYHVSPQQQRLYAYPSMMHHHSMSAPITPSRQYANHSNSSAFSSSANPDEDWTKISDLAERRRIQNRIAQRNYRKKIKRRLEDLERRAGGIPILTKTAKSRKPQYTLAAISAAAAAAQQATQAQARQQAQVQAQAHAAAAAAHQVAAVAAVASRQPSPYHSQQQEDLFYASSYDDPHGSRRSHSPMYTTAATTSPYATTTTTTHDDSSAASTATSRGAADYRPYEYSDWATMGAAAVPVTLPSMTHIADGLLKREPLDESGCGGGDAVAQAVVTGAMTPYMATYGFLTTTTSMDPYGSSPHTPPLSSSYDHSTCSDASYEYPTTPLSMASPQ